MKRRVVGAGLMLLGLAVLAGCADERTGEAAPIPLLEYQWTQKAGDVVKDLERRAGLTRMDKFIYYFGMGPRGSYRGVESQKAAIRQKMEKISDARPRDRKDMAGADRVISFQGRLPVVGWWVSPTFFFADDRLVFVSASPGFLVNLTASEMEAYLTDLKSTLDGHGGEILHETVREDEAKGLITYNFRWQNERTAILLTAAINKAKDKPGMVVLIFQDRLFIEKRAAETSY